MNATELVPFIIHLSFSKVTHYYHQWRITNGLKHV